MTSTRKSKKKRLQRGVATGSSARVREQRSPTDPPYQLSPSAAERASPASSNVDTGDDNTLDNALIPQELQTQEDSPLIASLVARIESLESELKSAQSFIENLHQKNTLGMYSNLNLLRKLSGNISQTTGH